MTDLQSRDGGMAQVDAPDSNLFRLLVEAVGDYAIFMLDPTGRVMSWNAGAQRIKGYSAEEIVGRHFSIFYLEPDRRRQHPEEELRVALASGSYAEEGWRLRKDGTRFWASVLITALRDARGRHVGFAKVTRDMTERRRAEEQLRQSEERLRLLIESVRDYAIFMLEPDGTIATWNSGAQNLKGYSAQEAIGKHFRIFYPPEALAAGNPERELQIAAVEGRYQEEGWRLRKNGERFWANVAITAVHDPVSRELRGFAKVTRDLTEQRRLAEEAREAAERAGMERARTIEAQNALRLRDEFISVAAHELRTPLTALQLKVQGALAALHHAAAGPEQASRQLERLGSALRQIERLAQLVERLLDVSRIVRGALVMHLEHTDLGALVQQVAEDFREPALQAGSELHVHAAAGVGGSWDRSRLEQVVVNLLSNAVKYGAGRPVEIAVEATDTGARLIVADQGIGIAPEDAERIFARFERAAPVRHYGGLGLGLYLTRNIVEAHGGSIRVLSAPGRGATFVVELPRQAVIQGPARSDRVEPKA